MRRLWIWTAIIAFDSNELIDLLKFCSNIKTFKCLYIQFFFEFRIFIITWNFAQIAKRALNENNGAEGAKNRLKQTNFSLLFSWKNRPNCYNVPKRVMFKKKFSKRRRERKGRKNFYILDIFFMWSHFAFDERAI